MSCAAETSVLCAAAEDGAARSAPMRVDGAETGRVRTPLVALVCVVSDGALEQVSGSLKGCEVRSHDFKLQLDGAKSFSCDASSVTHSPFSSSPPRAWRDRCQRRTHPQHGDARRP